MDEMKQLILAMWLNFIFLMELTQMEVSAFLTMTEPFVTLAGASYVSDTLLSSF